MGEVPSHSCEWLKPPVCGGNGDTPRAVALVMDAFRNLSRYLVMLIISYEGDISSVLLVCTRMFSPSKCYALPPSFYLNIYGHHHLDLAIVPLCIVFPSHILRDFSIISKEEYGARGRRASNLSRCSGWRSIGGFVPPPYCPAPITVTRYNCAISPRDNKKQGRSLFFCHGFGEGVAFADSDGLVDIPGVRGEICLQSSLDFAFPRTILGGPVSGSRHCVVTYCLMKTLTS